MNGSSVPAGEPGPPGPMGSLFIIPLNLGVGSSSFARAATFRDLLQKHLVSFFDKVISTNKYITVVNILICFSFIFLQLSLKGVRGARGMTGVTGPEGGPGEPGVKGEVGHPGDTGYQGPRGPMGPPGRQGSSVSYFINTVI